MSEGLIQSKTLLHALSRAPDNVIISHSLL